MKLHHIPYRIFGPSAKQLINGKKEEQAPASKSYCEEEDQPDYYCDESGLFI